MNNGLIYTMHETVADLQDVLRRNGFVPCDIPACNCGSWHARYGLPERMNEIKDMLSEAGHPLCNDNGNLVRNALRELIAERDRLATRAETLSHAKRATESATSEKLSHAETACQLLTFGEVSVRIGDAKAVRTFTETEYEHWRYPREAIGRMADVAAYEAIEAGITGAQS